MGYSITSNIFEEGSEAAREFEHTAYQALILHDHSIDTDPSPRPGGITTDDLAAAFKSVHNKTGDRFAFFVATAPPEGYRGWQHLRTAFRNQQSDRRLSGYELQNLNLALARCFGLDLSALPSVLISPALWSGDFVGVRNLQSAGELTQLLNFVNDLATIVPDEYGERDRHQLLRKALETSGQRSLIETTDPQSSRLRPTRLGNILTLKNEGSVSWEMTFPTFERFVDQKKARDGNAHDLLDDLKIDWLLTQSAEGKKSPPSGGNEQLLDETSAIYWSQSKWLLNNAKEWSAGDFSPACSGFWKTVELEFSMSVVQAARRHRGISMEQYYARRDPDKKEMKEEVPHWPDKQKRFRLNEKLRSDPTRHTFPSLGVQATVLEWAQKEQIISTPPEDVENIANALRELNRIRNAGSHTERVSASDATDTFEKARKILETLLAIKASEKFPPLRMPDLERETTYPDPQQVLDEFRSERTARRETGRRAYATNVPGLEATIRAVAEQLLMEHAEDPNPDSRKLAQEKALLLELENRLLKLAASIQLLSAGRAADRTRWHRLIRDALRDARVTGDNPKLQ